MKPNVIATARLAKDKLVSMGFKDADQLIIIQLPDGKTLFLDDLSVVNKLADLGFKEAEELTIVDLPEKVRLFGAEQDSHENADDILSELNELRKQPTDSFESRLSVSEVIHYDMTWGYPR